MGDAVEVGPVLKQLHNPVVDDSFFLVRFVVLVVIVIGPLNFCLSRHLCFSILWVLLGLLYLPPLLVLGAIVLFLHNVKNILNFLIVNVRSGNISIIVEM